MRNLFKMHANPASLKGYSQALEKVPSIAWFDNYMNDDNMDRNITDPSELRKREALWLQEPEAAVEYASIILKGRWPKAEKMISKNARASLHYAIQVIKGRWPPGEIAIARNPNVLKSYDDFLKGSPKFNAFLKDLAQSLKK